jgi:hypothetical protein
MMRLLTLFVMLGSVAAAGNLHAQPAADTVKGTPAQPAVPQQQTPPAGKSAKPAGKPAATFNPSEKISADSAVSFPVDI